MSNILVLPGTKWQQNLILKIKEMGHCVYLADPNPECVCHGLVDFHLVTDIFDEKKIGNFIINNHIEAITSDECDIATPMVAKLAGEYNLATIGCSMAALYTDKYMMRDFCKKHGFAYPEYCLCENVNEAHEFYDRMNCKLIIKPLDCNSSKGVFTIDSHEDIGRHFDESISFSRSKKNVILERYISGVEFTVDGIKTPDDYKVLAISRKKHFKHNENVANELYFSECDEEFDYELLRETNEKFISLSGLPFGFTHAEYKYENGVFYLIEIAARGGGNQISAIVTQFMSGLDTYEYLIDWSLGKKVCPDLSAVNYKTDRCAVLQFFETPSHGGTVDKIEGEELLINDKRIKDYSFNFRPGDVIEECVSDSARIGYYVACCDSKAELDALMERIKKTVKISILEEQK